MNKSETPKPASYVVGYGKPPKEHQFKRGVSGNPVGRPKKKTPAHIFDAAQGGLEELIMAEAARAMPITEKGKVGNIPTIQAAIRSLAISSVKGNVRASTALIKIVERAQDKITQDVLDNLTSAAKYQQSAREAFAICDARGQTRPRIIPHPDDMVIDYDHARVLFNGPQDEAEQAQWDKRWQFCNDLEEEIQGLQSILATDPDRSDIAKIIEGLKAEIALEKVMYPDELTRRKPGFQLQKWRREGIVRLGIRQKYSHTALEFNA